MRFKSLLILPLLVVALQAADKVIRIDFCAEPNGTPVPTPLIFPPEFPTIYVGDNVEIIVDTCDIVNGPINNMVIGFNGEARQATPTGIPGQYSYFFSIENPGLFPLIVTTINDYGNSTTSNEIAIAITVASSPTVTITSLTNGGDSPYSLGDIIAIDISASDSDGNVTQVEVFNGANSIGLANLVGVDTYRFYYQASSPGLLNLQVRATDDLGNIGFSDLEPITVLPQYPSETLDSDDDATDFTSPTWQGIQTKAISRPAPLIVDIQKKNNGIVSLSWNAETNKYYSVFRSGNLNEPFIPIENKYKVINLNNFDYNFNGNSVFFKITESNLGTYLGDAWEALTFGDTDNLIPGSRVRIYRNYVSDIASFDDGYQDIIYINESKALIIENDGDFEIGNYTITDIDTLSGTFNFFNRKAFNKPGARIEFPADLSIPLVFDESSPLNITRSYPDPDPEFTDNWTINENIYFNYPSTLMASDLINKTFKVYAFNDSTDFASYVELNFNTNDTGTILLGSGEIDINYAFEKSTHSVANLSFSFQPQIPYTSQLVGSNESINVSVTFFSFNASSGYFYGTIESGGSINEIYGYYGEDSIPVDHLYGYPLSQIVLLNDQNNDSLVTQEDAEIFMTNNPGIYWLYPSLGSLPTISEIIGNVTPEMPELQEN